MTTLIENNTKKKDVNLKTIYILDNYVWHATLEYYKL